MTPPLSILDLAIIARGEGARQALEGSVALARRAEARGYHRVWYAEHHNIPSIASSSPAVLTAHIATQTTSIRLGAGGVMLPNHAPLTIAEQFGTLAALHPGRIDLGVGRAPGGDQATFRALRRHPSAADSFPDDVIELQAYLKGESVVDGVEATPGGGSDVPLYILGSSLFGARLAARLGLPYAFASHFAPAALRQAVSLYRREFVPSSALATPWVIAGLNVLAADSVDEARAQLLAVRRARVGLFVGGGRRHFSDAEADAILRSPQARFLDEMMHHTAMGTADDVRAALVDFAAFADADELMLAHLAPTLEGRLRSVDIVADVALEKAAA